MTGRTLVQRSLRHYWRTHLGVAGGVAVSVAVILGALVVGDSVRGSLRAQALARLGATRLAVGAGERFFLDDLAGRLASELDAEACAAITVSAVAFDDTADRRAYDVQVLGIDDRFATVTRGEIELTRPDGVVLNDRLARQLDVAAGDMIVLRVDKPGAIARDAPLSKIDDTSAAMRLTVEAVTRPEGVGDFGLRASQIPPFNAFVRREALADKLDLAGRANLLLVGGGSRGPTADRANAALRSVWRLADAGLELRRLADSARGQIELRSRRVFLDDAVVEAAGTAVPGATRVFTYFVNELRVGERATPYSFVAAIEPAGGHPVGRVQPGSSPSTADRGHPSEPGSTRPTTLPADLADDEIAINTWLADDLDARPGQTLTMRYYVLGPMRKLVERTAEFRVTSVVPMAAADRELMPDFPGLADSDNCRDWDPGIPIDLDRIRDKDERYWDDYRGTPKAFVTRTAGQRLWSNRFGDLTAMRWPGADRTVEALGDAIRGRLDPAAVGLSFQPLRERALAAGRGASDFGGLFIGFSFFLIVAALLLTALLFALGVEQRTEQVGTLLAVGFTPRRVRRLLLAEGAALAIVGGAVGVLGGLGYTRAMVWALSSLWRPAGATGIEFHAEAPTLLIGGPAGIVVALLTIWLSLRRQARQPARALLAGPDAAGDLAAGDRRTPGRTSLWIAAIAVLGGAGTLAGGLVADKPSPAAFFAAGALLLIAGLAGVDRLLGRLATRSRSSRPSIGSLGLRNGSRRRGRSLAVVGLLACGSFLVISVAANRQDPSAGADARASGTGGFALIAESSLPVMVDLNSAEGREAYGLSDADMAGVRVVQLRLSDGDDASCLNLNQAQRPRLLGVDPDELASRGAFTFTHRVDRGDAEGWELLEAEVTPSPKSPHPDLLAPLGSAQGRRAEGAGGGAVPVVGDAATVDWGLKVSPGETIAVEDESGQTVPLRLVGVVANSMLQGSLLMAEDDFVRLFPSTSGYRVFLIDAPPDRVEAVRTRLADALADVGLEVTPAAERLAAFNEVINTYLSIFGSLGGLGLLLGSVGLGVVVLRNVLQRRSEFATLRAIGFKRPMLRWIVFAEHGALLLLGLACGVVCGIVSVTPALLSPGARVPYTSLTVTLAAVLGSGLLWTWLASVAALRGPLLAALRND